MKYLYEYTAGDLFYFRGAIHMKTNGAFPYNSVNLETGDVVAVPSHAPLSETELTLTFT